jgi:1-phosphatidylinositol phosphodiesterase
MAVNIAVRNLTAEPLEIKSIEYYKGTPPSINPIETLGRIAANATCTIGLTAPRPTGTVACQIQEDATAASQEQLSIRIEPFTTTTLDKALSSATDVIRLTISAAGHVYHTEVPPNKLHSNTLRPATPSAASAPAFSTIYKAASAHLAILTAAPLATWLSYLPDATPLSALSIPGAHNAPTCHVSLPSVRCQAVSPRTLLEHGVRFLDVRVCPPPPQPGEGEGEENGAAVGAGNHQQQHKQHDDNKDPLVLVHGAFPVSLTGAKRLGTHLLAPVRAFLAAHPRETVVLSLKREGARNGTSDAQLARILRNTYAAGGGGDEDGGDKKDGGDKAGAVGSWWTEPRVPRLGEARGRIVLLRRFALDAGGERCHGGRGWGLDGAGWAFNADCDVRGDVAVQDRCEVLEPAGIEGKVAAARAHLERCGALIVAGADKKEAKPAPPLYLNFLSASNFWRMACWPERIAARLNPAVLAHLCEKHVVDRPEADWSTGIVVCDWVGLAGDWDLLRCIVGMNAKVVARMKTLPAA